MAYLKLAAVALIIIAFTVILYLIDKKTKFHDLSYTTKQIVFGIIYGGLAAMATHLGVPIDGAVINVRDAAPLTAALVFGAPAGIISGIIGGLERFFAVYWGAGAYTRVACSIATFLAGLGGAALRKFMFDNKKAAWYYGLSTGLVMEVLHMLLIFITKMNDVSTAFYFVKKCTAPMMLSNGLTVMLALTAVAVIGKEKSVFPKDHKKLSATFQRWLMACVIIAFLVTSEFTNVLQTKLSSGDTEQILSLNISDVKADIKDASDENLLNITNGVAEDIDSAVSVDDDYLRALAAQNKNDVSEINIVDANGIITASTNDAYVGFDMKSGAQSKAFMVLTKGTEEYVQSYQPTANDASVYMKYAGVALSSGGYVQVGYNAERFQKDIDSQVSGLTANRHIGKSGGIIIADADRTIVSDNSGRTGKKLELSGLDTAKENVCYKGKRSGAEYYVMYTMSEGYYIIGYMPASDADMTRNVSVYVMIFMEVCVFAAIFILIYFLVKKLVVENIRKINNDLAQITGGNLDVSVDVRSNVEFASLSDDINSTVDTLKHYIDEAAARIDKELEFAREIQLSALPSVYPPYPERKDIDLFAAMYTAKEVGGDFYDHFFIGHDKMVLVIADVSGKGIPASLFMMKSKTLIKSLAETRTLTPSQIFDGANSELCNGNDAQMFVTAWIGIYDIKAGTLTCSNAGHEYPAIRHKDGSFEFVRDKHGLVLAAMESSRYREYELPLAPGDTIFVYTDGVTEATNTQNELFSEDRLLKALNEVPDSGAETIITHVKQRIDEFAGDADQFDDITMLCLKVNETQGDDELTVDATLENLDTVQEFIEKKLTDEGCPKKTAIQISIAVEEIYVNIAHYAYAPGTGSATVRAYICDDPHGIVIRFYDRGVPFDPLAKPDADTTLSADEREIGGLGILMVKKSMDEVTYEYKDGENILTLRKNF